MTTCAVIKVFFSGAGGFLFFFFYRPWGSPSFSPEELLFVMVFANAEPGFFS